MACRISRRLAPLSEPLQSGQTVEIITAPGTQPNPAWLSFVKTGKRAATYDTISRIRNTLNPLPWGRRLLNKALASFGAQLDEVPQRHIEAVLLQTNLQSVDDLLEDIGLGNRMSYMIAKRLATNAERGRRESERTGKEAGSLAIRGSEGIVMNFAKCCHPIPGDPIVGHISSGRGMVIHTDDCNNIADVRDNQEKCLEVSWDPEVEGEFSVELRVELENQRGIIATLATTITGAEANIEKISTVERDARLSIVNLSINVKNRVHLARS